MKPKPLIMIGLDGAEPTLIEAWMEDGSLPNLRKAREMGAYARVNDPEDQFIELPWITFYTGVNQGNHGAYHHIQWVAENMAYQGIAPSFLGLRPFWRNFADPELKTIAIDVPHTPKNPKEISIEINGYASYESLKGLNYFPKEIEKKIYQKVGKPIIHHDKYEPFTVPELQKMKRVLEKQISSLSKLSQYLLETEDWDLFLIVFSATHRGGHRFWGPSNTLEGESEQSVKEVGNYLKEIYQACDKAVGEILNQLPEKCQIYICSLHGMGDNQSRNALLGKMLEKIIDGNAAQGDEKMLFMRLIAVVRKLIPKDFRHSVKNIFPIGWQRKLTSLLWTGDKKWESIPAFEIIGDYFGAVQINLKGREKQGWVNPGADYEAWAQRIIEGLNSFKDADSGEKIVKDVIKRENLGLKGEYLHRFPDLIVKWMDTPAAQHRAIYSDRYGEIPWPTPKRNPDGRSGNHRNQGFFIGIGDQFKSNSTLKSIQIVDIASMILSSLGQAIPAKMEGTLISNNTEKDVY